MLNILSKVNMSIAVAAVCAVTLLGSHFWAYNTGKKVAQVSQLEAITEYQSTIAQLHEEIYIEQAKVKEAGQKSTTTIIKVADPTGCADTDAPADILRELN